MTKFSRLHVEGLPEDITVRELETLFGKYGDVGEIWISRQPKGFAIVELDDLKASRDAVVQLSNTEFRGHLIRLQNSDRRHRGWAQSGEFGETLEGSDSSRSHSPRRKLSTSRSRSRSCSESRFPLTGKSSLERLQRGRKRRVISFNRAETRSKSIERKPLGSRGSQSPDSRHLLRHYVDSDGDVALSLHGSEEDRSISPDRVPQATQTQRSRSRSIDSD